MSLSYSRSFERFLIYRQHNLWKRAEKPTARRVGLLSIFLDSTSPLTSKQCVRTSIARVAFFIWWGKGWGYVATNWALLIDHPSATFSMFPFSLRIHSVLNRSNQDTTVSYPLISYMFSWPYMVKWHNSGIIKSKINKHKDARLVVLFYCQNLR